MEVFPYRYTLAKVKKQNWIEFTKRAKKDFPFVRPEGTKQLSKPCFLLYRIFKNNHSYFGVIANSKTDDYNTGKIVKHEHTIALKEESQRRLLGERGGLIKPVLLTYKSIPKFEQWMLKYSRSCQPDYSYNFIQEGYHDVWKISKTKHIATIQSHLGTLEKAYIADGHHRSASMSKLFLENNMADRYAQLMTAYFSLDSLEIFSFHRVLNYGDDFKNALELLSELKTRFHFRPIPHVPNDLNHLGKHKLIMYFKAQWYELEWKAKILDQTKETLLTDAGLMNDFVCRDVFHCEDIRTDERIQYIEATKGRGELLKAMSREGNSIGFVLSPMSKSDFYDLVKMETILPPKSTLFDPRLKNGIVSQELD